MRRAECRRRPRERRPSHGRAGPRALAYAGRGARGSQTARARGCRSGAPRTHVTPGGGKDRREPAGCGPVPRRPREARVSHTDLRRPTTEACAHLRGDRCATRRVSQLSPDLRRPGPGLLPGSGHVGPRGGSLLSLAARLCRAVPPPGRLHAVPGDAQRPDRGRGTAPGGARSSLGRDPDRRLPRRRPNVRRGDVLRGPPQRPAVPSDPPGPDPLRRCRRVRRPESLRETLHLADRMDVTVELEES